MPAKANWISNYTHLMEQPTVFYRRYHARRMMGDNSAISVNLAWAYTGLRVMHSFWQANVNAIPVSSAFWGLWLCLIPYWLLGQSCWHTNRIRASGRDPLAYRYQP